MIKILTCGTIMVDILAVDLEKIAGSGEVIYLEREIETRIGGHPIDVGIDLVKLGINPRKIEVLAAIGQGVFGNYVKKIIEDYKISTSCFQQIKERDTGKNVILEIKGEDRRFHIDPGANWYLDPEWVKKIIRESSFNIFSIRPGYSGIDLNLREIFEEVKKKNAFLFLDIMEPHPKRLPLFLLPELHFVDAVHCNEKEAMINTGKNNPEKAVRELLNQGVKVIFLTKGEKGAEIITEDFRISQPCFQKVKAIDATGCGDAFCAGVIYKLAEYNQFEDVRKLSEENLKELLVFAQAAGASAATQPGCVEGVSKQTVDAILNQEKREIIKKTII
jgi:fructokinase